MLARDFFDHSSSDGTPFDRRIRRYVNARMLGEMLALDRSRRGGASTVVRMWMESAAAPGDPPDLRFPPDRHRAPLGRGAGGRHRRLLPRR